MPSDRRLIEDYIPIREISAEASREKSIRKGHISTLHLWWARRPLVAARAAVYAALVPAPRTDEEREQYTREMVELCRWQVSEETLQRARERILAANGDAPPKVLDMFAGGGAIPLEALRLGCEAYAVDLNPVAHLIQLCTLVYPQQYGPKLAEEVEHWGMWVLERVKAEIGDLYPSIPASYDRHRSVADAVATKPGRGRKSRQRTRHDEEDDEFGDLELAGKGHQDNMFAIAEQRDMFSSASHRVGALPTTLTPVAYLWTRTVRCPNPGCGAIVPLVRQTWLAKKEGRYVALRMHADARQGAGPRRVRFEVAEAASEEGLGFDPAGFSERGNATCPFCGATVDNDYVKAEGKAGRMGAQPMAVVCTRSGRSGKMYISADDLDPALLPDDAAIRARIERLCAETGLTVPEEPIFSGDSRAFFTHLYGIDAFGKLFTPRQMMTLLTFCKWIRSAHQEMTRHSVEPDLTNALIAYLAVGLDKVASRGSASGIWHSGRETLESPVARGTLPLTWDFPESNPIGEGSGNWIDSLQWTTDAVASAAASGDKSAHVYRMNAQQLGLPNGKYDAVITDPPYYDNIPYSHLADYFYVWLKRLLGDVFPEHFASELTPKKQEAVAEPARFNGDRQRSRAQYEDMMQKAFGEAFRVLKPGAPLVCVYAHRTTAGWSALADSLRNAGFLITEAWPLDTELKTGYRGLRASFASSIFMVARKREGEAVGNYVRDVRPQLHAIARERVRTLRTAGVSGADLVIACVGAGLRAYTQFARVELPNGEELAASAFLDEVQRAVLEVILADVMGVPESGVGAVDKVSQYYVLARYQYGAATVDFDEANVLARGVGVELDGPRALTAGPNPLVKKTKTMVEWRDYRARGAHEELGVLDGHEPPLIDVLQRLLWLNDHQPAAVPQFLAEARPDVARLKLVAEALGGKGLAAEPVPGAARDERTEEQKALGRLLPAWKRVVEDIVQGRLL